MPLTANEKNYRATYRAVSKGVYIEDLSYWQCIETSNFQKQAEENGNNFKINISGVIYDTVEKGVECFDGSNYAWLQNNEHQVIAMVFLVRISKDKFHWWCYPSRLESVLNCLSKLVQNVQHKQDLCLFSVLGPESNDRIVPKDKNQEYLDKVFRIHAVDIPVTRDMTKESGEVYIATIPTNR